MACDSCLVHIKKLALDKASLLVEVRNLRLEVTRLRDEVQHAQRELARQNARVIELQIIKTMKDESGEELEG